MLLKKLLLPFLFFYFYNAFPQKEKIIWIDQTANLKRTVNIDSLYNLFAKIKKAGFTSICLVVKPLSGEVIYNSKIAPKMTEWNSIQIDKNFDLLDETIKLNKKFSFKIYALMEVLTEGNKQIKRGPIFTHSPNWQSYVYDTLDNKPQIIKITDWKYGIPAFTNPYMKEVRDYIKNIAKEIIKYDIDGIVFDRFRFNGINSDFSNLAKEQFIKFLQNKYNDFNPVQFSFPDDVYILKIIENKKTITEGKYYKDWLFFRSMSIRNLLSELTDTIRNIKPDIIIGDYVGSWYPLYFEYGVNWGSNEYTVPYSWADKDYKKSGYAEKLDWLAIGCYYKDITKADALKNKKGWHESVEGGCEIGRQVTLNKIPVFATLYVVDYKNNPQKFMDAISMGYKSSNGIAIFDVSHIEEYNWWKYIEDVFYKKDK